MKVRSLVASTAVAVAGLTVVAPASHAAAPLAPKAGVAGVAGIATGTTTTTTDKVKPKIRISVPRKPSKVRSWRVVRGTASDAGSGLSMVGVFVAQKRGSRWWTYDFATKKWLKGYAKLGPTEKKSKASPAFVQAPQGKWASPAIKGLRRGSTVFEAAAFDKAGNIKAIRLGPRRLR
jgi:hypothetical protein